MAIEGTVFGVTLGLLLGLVLLRYSGYLEHIRKAAAFVAAGAMLYIIDIAWNTGTFATKISSVAAVWLTFALELIAFIFITIGALWAAIELMTRVK